MRMTLIKNSVTRFAFLILIITSVFAGACSSRKSRLDRRNLIPEKELVSILTDIHIADGLLVLPKINSWSISLDSITSYYHVIEKHGYTKEIMDKTMAYYFIKNPKKLNKIYDQVLGILSEMESQAEKESMNQFAQVSNQWPGKDYYAVPSHSGNDSTMFDLTIYRSGIYTLSFSATLFPDDQSHNPKTTAYLVSPDSIITGKKVMLKSINYLKDGRPHNYTVNFSTPENKIIHLRGWLYDFNNLSVGFEKHFKIEDISLTYSSMEL
jgi:hypothetical protein